MTRRICTLALGGLMAAAQGWSQAPAAGKDAADAQKLQDAAGKGFPMPANTNLTVNGNASVQAVLLPATICRSLFGRNVADNYAAIELIVSNRSQDSALIVHSVYIDYSRWLLSGLGAAVEDVKDQLANTAATQPNQVASAEYRIVRGEALDAQQWTARNWTMRILDFLGAGAAGAEFSIAEKGIVKAIGLFAGTGVSGAKTLWPDSSVAQLNRISDFGFRANMTIPKASSDILVGFFPIDRFILKTAVGAL